MITSLVLLLSVAMLSEESEAATPVGIPARIEQLVLPGSLLEARLLTERSMPLVVRVVAAYPHGDSYRYDIEYYGLEPGTYDLLESLQREDGSDVKGLTPIMVTIRTSLPPGQVQPNELVPQRGPSLGGYRVLLVVAGVFWVLGLFAILLVGRKRKSIQLAAEAHETTFEERLRSALRAAEEGSLGEGDRAELERMVLAHWRRRLGLERMEASAAMAVMRQDAEASAALEQLERWLHDPGGQLPPDFQRLVEPANGSRTTKQA